MQFVLTFLQDNVTLSTAMLLTAAAFRDAMIRVVTSACQGAQCHCLWRALWYQAAQIHDGLVVCEVSFRSAVVLRSALAFGVQVWGFGG